MKTFFSFILLFVASQTFANDIITDFKISYDSDYATITQADVGYEDSFAKWNLGAFQGIYNISETIGNAQFNHTFLTARRAWRDVTFESSIGNVYNSDWGVVTGNALVTWFPSEKQRIDLSYTRDLIGTIDGVNQNLSFNQYNISTDYDLTNRITLVGGYSYRAVSDGNKQNTLLGKVEWYPVKHWMFDVVYTQFTYDFYNSAYWSPEKFNQTIVGAHYTKNVDSWNWGVYGYVGGQQEDNTAGSYYEVGAHTGGWLTNDIWLDAYTNYLKTDDYRRTAVGVRLDFVF